MLRPRKGTLQREKENTKRRFEVRHRHIARPEGRSHPPALAAKEIRRLQSHARSEFLQQGFKMQAPLRRSMRAVTGIDFRMLVDQVRGGAGGDDLHVDLNELAHECGVEITGHDQDDTRTPPACWPLKRRSEHVAF
jgi:hypothetical protein